jgi:hypothetical protein
MLSAASVDYVRLSLRKRCEVEVGIVVKSVFGCREEAWPVQAIAALTMGDC